MEDKLIQIIGEDPWMVETLEIVRNLNLPDSWIGAGFVRNKVWDFLHNKVVRTPLNDIDVIYFNENQISEKEDLLIEKELISLNPHLKWSVKNQARMHLKHNHLPYKNCLEAISYWVETPTSVAIQINLDNKIRFIAPHGIEDLMQLKIKPTPGVSLDLFRRRVNEKKWLEKWPELEVIN